MAALARVLSALLLLHHAHSTDPDPGAKSPPEPRSPPDSLSALLTARPPRPLGSASASSASVGHPRADAFINDVTELLAGVSTKSIKGSGSGFNVIVTPPLFPAEDSWPGSCRLRSKRYVSDGLCMSPRPLTEVVCADSCVMNAWTKGGARPLPWRCSDAGWRRRRVKLLCRDGSTRAYRVRVVQSCRCVPRHDPPRDQEQHRADRRSGSGRSHRRREGGSGGGRLA